VGVALGRFHNLGWSHGDFKWSNIFIDGGVGGDHENIYFIDLDAVKQASWLNFRSSRGRDLARFIVNAEDYDVEENIVRSFMAAYALTVGETMDDSLIAAGPALKNFENDTTRNMACVAIACFRTKPNTICKKKL